MIHCENIEEKMEKTLIEPQRPVGQYYANNIHVISVLKRRRKAQ